MKHDDNDVERERTTREIVRTRESIRKKHRALTASNMETEVALESRYRPIVEPLRRIAEQRDAAVEPAAAAEPIRRK